jgi:hypothetical protein
MGFKALSFIIVTAALLVQPTYAATQAAPLTAAECKHKFEESFKEATNLKRTRDSISAMQDHGMILPTEAKAVLLNSDRTKAGYVMEIGSAQRTLFYLNESGERSNTILHSASNNGQDVSDYRYGKSKTGYTSLERLDALLEKEKEEVEEIYKKIGSVHHPWEVTKYFIFGDTSTTGNHTDGHSWMGIRFQLQPEGPWQTIKMHVRLLDPTVKKQDDALGVLGINLIFAAFYKSDSIESFMATLKENITLEDHGGLEIDSMHFEGANFAQWTDDYVAISLLKAGLTETISINAQGQFVPPSSQFHQKAVLLHGLDPKLSNVLDQKTWTEAIASFGTASQVPPETVEGINWIPFSQLNSKGGLDVNETLKLIKIFEGNNQPIIITDFKTDDALSEWNRSFKVKNIGILYDFAKQIPVSHNEKTVSSDAAHLIRYSN